MDLENIKSFEELVKNMSEYINQVTRHLMPYGLCATYHHCDKCPFGIIVYRDSGVDNQMCEAVFRLGHRLNKVVEAIENGEFNNK